MSNILERVKGYVVGPIEMEASEFFEMLDEIRELQEANEQLRGWREDLISAIAALEDQLRVKPPPSFTVYKLQDGILFAQLIKELWPVGGNRYEIVIHGD
jgi:hypothetical protein